MISVLTVGRRTVCWSARNVTRGRRGLASNSVCRQATEKQTPLTLKGKNPMPVASPVVPENQVEFDIEEPVLPEQRLGQLSQLAEASRKWQRTVDLLEEELKKAKAELDKYNLELIPKLMDDLKIAKFTTQSGVVVEVKEDIRANPGGPKDLDRFTKVCEWLTEQGHDALIRHEVGIAFGPGEEEAVERVLAALNPVADVLNKPVADEKSINTNTFAAFVREQLKEGKVVPKFCNVFRQRVAKIVVPVQ